jgi:cytochrome b
MRDQKSIKVWDPLVRLFHWGLVTAFVLAYVSEDDWMTLHVYAGYTIMGLLAVRLIWGFVGPRYARFSDFVRSPSHVMAYLKGLASLHPPRYLGHNPAGGAMIVLLLLSLVLTTVTGLGAYGAEGYGPLAGWASGLVGLGREVMEEVHEFTANFTLFLVLVHVAGVLLGSLLHQENLVRAMITGRKPGLGGGSK